MRAAVWLVVMASGLLGCRNDCQQLCGAIQTYAQEDCALSFSDDEMRQCVKDQQRGDLRALVKTANEGVAEEEQITVGDRLEACERNLVNLREEVTCEDLEAYFRAPSASGDSGS